MLTIVCQISIPVSTEADEWTAAEVLRDEFTHIQTTNDTTDATAELENAAEASVELASRFLRYVAGELDEDAPGHAHFHPPQESLTASYLTSQDYHVIVAAFDTEVRKTLLASYFQALAVLETKNASDIPCTPSSSAETHADASIYALSGGQGTNEVHFDELQTLYEIYKPSLPLYPAMFSFLWSSNLERTHSTLTAWTARSDGCKRYVRSNLRLTIHRYHISQPHNPERRVPNSHP